MLNHFKLPGLIFAFVLLAAGNPTRAQLQLITNGNFETGNFTGWTLANQLNPADTTNADHFYISTPGSNTPAVDSYSYPTAPNPSGGNYYAVTASDYPGAHVLQQTFTVPAGTLSLQLSFQMFVNDQSGIGPLGTGLDYTTGGSYMDNQHAQVDILRAGAGDLSTSASDVLDNLYYGVDPGTFDANGNLIPNPYTDYSFNLTGVLTPGETYTLRFAEVDNDGPINMGVDNVSLIATTVPEPGVTTWLIGMAVVVVAASCKRLHRRASRV